MQSTRDVDEGHVANICQHSRFFVCASCELKDRTTAAGFLFAGDPLFTGAMSVAEKTERDPENGDQENGESSKKSKSGNFLDPMKVFIHNVVKWVGTAEAPCPVTGDFSFTIFPSFCPWVLVNQGIFKQAYVCQSQSQRWCAAPHSVGILLVPLVSQYCSWSPEVNQGSPHHRTMCLSSLVSTERNHESWAQQCCCSSTYGLVDCRSFVIVNQVECSFKWQSPI